MSSKTASKGATKQQSDIEANVPEEEEEATEEFQDPAAEQEEDEEAPPPKWKRYPRLAAWVALTVLSAISLTAIATDEIIEDGGAKTWSLIVTIVSLAVGFFLSVAYFWHRITEKIAGKLPEGIAAVIVLLFWIGGLPVIMSPDQGLAVSTSKIGVNFVKNANLYFFSWGAFVCIIYISGSFFREKIPKAKNAMTALKSKPQLAKWYMLLTISVVVLASAAEFHHSQECTQKKGSEPCKSNRYAISLGVISFLVCIGIIAATYATSVNAYVEGTTAFAMFAMYTAGIAVITFDRGSGITIGNLYFSTWAGFLVTIFLALDAHHALMDAFLAWRKKRKAKPQEKKESKSSKKKKKKSKSSGSRHHHGSTKRARSKPPEDESVIDENEFFDASQAEG